MKQPSDKPTMHTIHSPVMGSSENDVLRILILEDNAADAELMEDELQTAGIEYSVKRVETAKDFREALIDFSPLLVLSDYDLPDFSGAQALQLVQDTCPEVPFILVTGAIGEEKAIEILTSGATDYVLKNRIERLAPAVTRAMQEIRDRREREKAELSFKILVEQIPAVTYRIRPEGNSGFSYLYMSPQSKTIIGLPHTEFQANAELMMQRIHPADREWVLETKSRSWAEDKSFCAEYRVYHTDGRVLWIHDEAIAVRDRSGATLYYQGILTDITELKKVQEDIRRAHDTLEVRVQERTEELEAFTSSISHDLKGPVWMLSKYIRMIFDDHGGEMDPDLEDRIRIISRTVDQMDRLINDLLHLSRVNRTELCISNINLREIILDVWTEIQNMHPERKILFAVKELPPATGDRNLIRQVVYNLISNAVKFSRTRQGTAVIDVGGYMEGDMSVVYVRDNGVGFDMDQYDKLFELFGRLHGSEYEGTGVGLAIVYRIIQRHGGWIRAEGRAHEGATFVFSLPKAAVGSRNI